MKLQSSFTELFKNKIPKKFFIAEDERMVEENINEYLNLKQSSYCSNENTEEWKQEYDLIYNSYLIDK
jgi:hypothetical protein